MFFREYKRHIEALLFAGGNPLPAGRIADIISVPVDHVELLLADLADEYRREQRGLAIVEVAGGYQMCTCPEFAPYIERLAEEQDHRLSVAAMETLAIIAFKQPITRQEMEGIRGVKVDGIVNKLLERRLIREVGRKEAIGRPILYGTTDEFLECFGLRSLADMPDLAQFLVDTTDTEETDVSDGDGPAEE